MTETTKFPDTRPIDFQYEAALIAEECAEVTQIIGKSFRFGWDSYNPADPTNMNIDLLHAEVGDVEAAIEFGVDRGLLDRSKITKRKAEKLKKLKALSPPTMLAHDQKVALANEGLQLNAKEERAALGVVLVVVAILLGGTWFFASSQATKPIQREASEAAVACFQSGGPTEACDALQAIATR